MAEQTSLGLTKAELNEFYNKLLDNDNLDLLDQLIASRIEKSLIAHNLLTENTEMVLGADQGKVLDDKIGVLTNNLAVQTTDLAVYKSTSVASVIRFYSKHTASGLIVINFVGTITLTSDNSITVATLPTELRPSQTAEGTCIIGGSNQTMRATVSSNGVISLEKGTIVAGTNMSYISLAYYR